MFPETSGQTHYMTRCNNPEHHQITNPKPMTQALNVQLQNREGPISWHPQLPEPIPSPLHFFEWRRVYEKGNTGGPDQPGCILLTSAIIPDGKAAEACPEL